MRGSFKSLRLFRRPMEATQPNTTQHFVADKLCRLCACSSACANEELVPVFGDKGLELNLVEKIHTHMPIMITPDDVLPVMLCVLCIEKLELCHRFVEGSLAADAKLRKVLGFELDSNHTEEESIELTDYMNSSEEIKNPYDVHKDQHNTVPCDENSSEKTCVDNKKVLNSAVSAEINNSEQTKIHLKRAEELLETHEEANLTENSGVSTNVLKETDFSEYSVNQQISKQNKIDENKNDSVNMNSKDGITSNKTKKTPKFKVLIMKMKCGPKTLQTVDIQNVLDLVKSSGKMNKFFRKRTSDVRRKHYQHEGPSGLSSSLTSTQIEHSSQPLDMPSPTQTSALTIGNTNTTDVKHQMFANVIEDHNYSHVTESLQCVYCKKTFGSEDECMSHFSNFHYNTFYCRFCDSFHKSMKLFVEHKKHHTRDHLEGKGNLLSHKNSDCIIENDKQIETVSNNSDVLKVGPNILQEDSKTDIDVLPANQNISEGKIEKVGTVDIHVNSGKFLGKSGLTKNVHKIHFKLSKELEKLDKSCSSRIMECMYRIIKNKEFSGIKIPEIPMFDHINGSGKEMKSEMNKQTETAMDKIEEEEIIWKCSQCSSLFTSMKKCKDHERTVHPKENLCFYCNKYFNTQESLNTHVNEFHSDKNHFSCELCGIMFWTSHSLVKHMRLHKISDDGYDLQTGKLVKIYKCKECGKDFETKSRFESHRHSHGEPTFLCNVCGKSIRHYASFQNHMSSHVEPQSMLRHCCATCGKTFKTGSSLKIHMCIHTNERPYFCTHCGKHFRTMSARSQHMKLHINARPYKCTECGKAFNRQDHLRLHLDSHKKKYKCIVCELTFVYFKELNEHKETNHSAEEIQNASVSKIGNENSEEYICKICGKTLNGNSNMQSHIISHETNKLFSCNTCGKKFSQTSNLTIHQRIHSNVKPYVCEMCGKGFSQRIQLKTHQHIHTGQKPHECRYCSKRFVARRQVICHERTHTGERPFECSKCPKAFSSKTSLKMHSTVHSDKRPFSCSLCHWSFKRQEALNQHFRIHTGERPFSCKVCGRGFKQSGDCKKHERAHLRNTDVEEDPTDSTLFPMEEINL